MTLFGAATQSLDPKQGRMSLARSGCIHGSTEDASVQISRTRTLPSTQSWIRKEEEPPTKDFPIPNLFRLCRIYDCVDHGVNLQSGHNMSLMVLTFNDEHDINSH